MTNRNNNSRRLISIYSSHPLALQVIEKAITSDPVLQNEAAVSCTLQIPVLEQPDQLLILDSCSRQQWLEIAIRWQQAGGRVIVLLSSGAAQQRQHLRSLYLGVSGLVAISANLNQELPRAVRCVLDGGLWIDRDTLREYVRRTNPSGHTRVDATPHLTVREEQVMNFLLQHYSNKLIGDALEISERTVKYHVSNILQKLRVGTRKELVAVQHVCDVDAGLAKYRPEISVTLPAVGTEPAGDTHTNGLIIAQ